MVIGSQVLKRIGKFRLIKIEISHLRNDYEVKCNAQATRMKGGVLIVHIINRAEQEKSISVTETARGRTKKKGGVI